MVHYTMVHYTMVHYTMVHYYMVHYSMVHYTMVHYTMVHYSIVHHSMVLTSWYTTLWYLWYTLLHNKSTCNMHVDALALRRNQFAGFQASIINNRLVFVSRLRNEKILMSFGVRLF